MFNRLEEPPFSSNLNPFMPFFYAQNKQQNLKKSLSEANGISKNDNCLWIKKKRTVTHPKLLLITKITFNE